MSTTMMTTRDRGDRYGAMEWAQSAVMPYSWEGITMFGTVLATHHKLHWLIHLLAQESEGDDHPAYAPRGVCHFHLYDGKMEAKDSSLSQLATDSEQMPDAPHTVSQPTQNKKPVITTNFYGH